MKRLVTLIILVFSVMLQGSPPPTITVTVRVFDGDKQIEELKKEDFTLYENNIPLDINGFNVHKKTVRPVSAAASSPRFFVLVFRLNLYNRQVREYIDFVFDHILGDKDRLLISSGGQTLFFEVIPDRVKAIAMIEGILRKEAALTRRKMYAEIIGMETFIDEVRNQSAREMDPKAGVGSMKGVHPHYYMKYFKNSIERYRDMLLGYKKNFLLPDISGYYDLCQQIQNNDSEKWLISFYQMPVLPKFSRQSRRMITGWIKELSQREWLDELDYVKKLERLQGDIDDAFEVSAEKFCELSWEVVQLLYKSGFSFHSIFMPPALETYSRDLGNKVEVKASIESGMKDRLREIARLTGGTFMVFDAGKMAAEDNPILKKDDVYYTLTYTPQNAENAGIKVEVNNNKYRSVYYDFAGSGYLKQLLEHDRMLTNSVKIENITFKGKKLSLVIKDFAIDKTEKTQNRGAGKLNVLVRMIDRQDQVVFHNQKTLLAQKESVSLSLDFKRLKKGKYYCIINVKDLITGKARARVSSFDIL